MHTHTHFNLLRISHTDGKYIHAFCMPLCIQQFVLVELFSFFHLCVQHRREARKCYAVCKYQQECLKGVHCTRVNFKHTYMHTTYALVMRFLCFASQHGWYALYFVEVLLPLSIHTLLVQPHFMYSFNQQNHASQYTYWCVCVCAVKIPLSDRTFTEGCFISRSTFPSFDVRSTQKISIEHNKTPLHVFYQLCCYRNSMRKVAYTNLMMRWVYTCWIVFCSVMIFHTEKNVSMPNGDKKKQFESITMGQTHKQRK